MTNQRDRLTLGCQGDAKPSAPLELPSGSEEGRSREVRRIKNLTLTLKYVFCLTNNSLEADVTSQNVWLRKYGGFTIFCSSTLAKNQILTEIVCYSQTPEEHPRWQHLSSPESSGIEYAKVIPQEGQEKQAE